MKKYLFDSNVYSLIFSENIPEKWVRYWKEVRSGTKKLIIFEMLISGIFYKNSRKYGFRMMREKLEWIKYLWGPRYTSRNRYLGSWSPKNRL